MQFSTWKHRRLTEMKAAPRHASLMTTTAYLHVVVYEERKLESSFAGEAQLSRQTCDARRPYDSAVIASIYFAARNAAWSVSAAHGSPVGAPPRSPYRRAQTTARGARTVPDRARARR